jgi:transposase
MEHVAIDLGSRESQVCIRDEQGAILLERKVATAKLGAYLSKRPHSRVILETCAEAFFVADAASAAGHQVRVVPATLVRQLGVGERGMKNDQRDARKLSEVSTRIDLPSVHVPSELSRERKRLCNSRKALLQSRVQLINYVRGQLRTHAVVLHKRSPSTFPASVRQLLLQYPEGIASHFERVLLAIESINEQLVEADRELLQVAEQDPLCLRLMQVPGVGPLIALRFVAVVDEPERFPSAHHLMSYVGLTPGESSSSLRRHRTGITKAGASDPGRCCAAGPASRWCNGRFGWQRAATDRSRWWRSRAKCWVCCGRCGSAARATGPSSRPPRLRAPTEHSRGLPKAR